MSPQHAAIAGPAPRTSRQAQLVSVDGKSFPLKSTQVSARAEGGLAATTLIQEFKNDHSEPLEVEYTMPLPADGAVIAYTVTFGEQVIRGEIEPREKAQQDFQRALEQGHTAGLLEEERADTFTQKLGNLPAGVDARVEIEVLQPLTFVTGAGLEVGPAWEYRFPTVVGVRYQGEPGRVPDAGKLDPPRADEDGTPVQLDLTLTIADGEPGFTAPGSPSHELEITGERDETRVGLTKSSPLDRDLVVRWRGAAERVGVRLAEGPGLSGDAGRYGLLTVTPPAVPEAKLARDLTILIDASGSMHGMPLENAKYVAKQLLGSLGRGDRFEVLAFASYVEKVSGGLVSVTDRKIAKHCRRIENLRTGGATEMANAVVEALGSLRPDSQRQVVMITDGYVGFEQRVIGHVLDHLPANSRLHLVGVGSSPNRTLTHGASRAGRGIEVLIGVDRKEDLVAAARRLCRATTAPVLTELSVAGSAVIGLAPERPADLFAGQPVKLAVELRPEGGTIEIEGKLAGSDGRWGKKLSVGALAEGAAAGSVLPLGAYFGREAVEDCEMQIAGGRVEGPEAALAELGMRHRIVTRETSMIAISEDPTVDPQDPRRKQRLSVEVPAGVSAEAVGLSRRGLKGLKRSSSRSRRTRMAVRGVADEFFALDAPGTMREERPSFLKKSSSVPPTVPFGRIVRAEKDLIIVEIEIVDGELTIPADGSILKVWCVDGEELEARLDGSLGTRPGEYGEGLTVRLALRFDGVPPSRPERIEWTDDDGEDHVVAIGDDNLEDQG